MHHWGCLPHARGGVSFLASSIVISVVSSPRPWGCFPIDFLAVYYYLVFPTPVGVFLYGWHLNAHHSRLPHARGGVSQGGAQKNSFRQSSPRPWGCFLIHLDNFHSYQVFPTPVGVFLSTH
ncbi:conserved hypothetical protein, membrane [methanotrophic bacterial endosymbiont of Bathymodiolus sp.]|nr:conserved hypothetical protein, membrane [methanotrophic bacterial endosymbiont of Bathymodiolus sp.]